MAAFTQRDFLDSGVLSRLSRIVLNARQPMLGTVTGIHKSAARGSSVEFAEYRKYVPGDDIKHIDWQVYARSDRFYIKEFEADTNLRCYIVLDCSASMQFEGEHGSKFDYARKLAATLAYMLVHQGDGVGLTAFNDKVCEDIPPRRSPTHLKSIFDIMGKMTPTGKSAIVDTIHKLAEKISRRAFVIVFSDLFTDIDPLLDAFQHMRFRKHDLSVFHLLDQQEVDFEFDRPIRFVDMESSFDLITDPSMIKGGYRKALDQYLEAMQKGCREFGVDYQRVITSADYEKVLSSFLLERVNRKKSGRK
ncbi:MAG: hypothetical protein ACI9TH_003282 [Kiritimatiellia bacterium]